MKRGNRGRHLGCCYCGGHHRWGLSAVGLCPAWHRLLGWQAHRPPVGAEGPVTGGGRYRGVSGSRPPGCPAGQAGGALHHDGRDHAPRRLRRSGSCAAPGAAEASSPCLVPPRAPPACLWCLLSLVRPRLSLPLPRTGATSRRRRGSAKVLAAKAVAAGNPEGASALAGSRSPFTIHAPVQGECSAGAPPPPSPAGRQTFPQSIEGRIGAGNAAALDERSR